MTAEATNEIQVEYVVLSRDFDRNNKPIIGLRNLTDEVEKKDRYYALDKSVKNLRPGSVYRIPTEIKENGAVAIYVRRAHFLRRADDAAAIVTEDRAWEVAQDAARREKKESGMVALEDLLLPVRKTYQQTNYRGRLAIEVLVLEALRKPVR